MLAARGNDGFGTTGLAWRARLLPIRALDPWGDGDTAAVAAGFRDAAQRGASIVNASMEGARSIAIADAIGDFPGTLFVVAAGNGGPALDDGDPEWPCMYTFDNLICVGAADAELAGSRRSRTTARSRSTSPRPASPRRRRRERGATHGLDRGLRDAAGRPLGLRRHR